MHILICSILRDNAPNMQRFFDQINTFVSTLADKHTFSISLYENDSIDDTPEFLKNYDYSKFKNHSVICDKLGTTKFGSVVSEERIANLANARNCAVEANDLYKEADYIFFVDCDVTYESHFVPTLLDFSSVGLKAPDMYSGVSLAPYRSTDFNIPKFVEFTKTINGEVFDKWRVYDTWSMRRTSNEEWGTWKDDVSVNIVSKFYGTFNSACLIKAEPFKQGIRYHHFNQRLGKFDLEHSVLAERFHSAGYSEIYVNQALFCFH